jgi:hypothetical protein
MPAQRGDISNQEMLLLGTSAKARPQKMFVSTIEISPVIKKPTRKFYTSIFSSCHLLQSLISVLVQRTRRRLLLDGFC